MILIVHPVITDLAKPQSKMRVRSGDAATTGTMMDCPSDGSPRSPMTRRMLAVRQDFDIFGTIIQRVAIFVMRMFIATEWVSDLLFGDHSMFVSPLLASATDLNFPITEWTSPMFAPRADRKGGPTKSLRITRAAPAINAPSWVRPLVGFVVSEGSNRLATQVASPNQWEHGLAV